MKTRSISWGIALVFTAVSLTTLRAQDEPVKTVKVRFRVFGWDNASADLNYAQAGKDVSAEIYEDLRSPFYDYAGPATITFYRVKTGADGKIERTPAAEADLSGAGSWPLLLFFVVPGGSGNYKVQVIPDDLNSFPAGSFKFANYTDVPISGSLGTQNFELHPTEMQTLLCLPSANTTTVFATVYAQTAQGKITVYTNNWALQPLMRTLVFVRKGSDSSTGFVARRIVESTVFPKDKENRASSQGSGR